MSVLDEQVHVSRATSRTWERDGDVGGDAHMLYDLGPTKAGLWRASPEGAAPAEVPIPARETILVLEGSVLVAVDRGEPYDLQVGDMLAIPAGALVGWDASADCLQERAQTPRLMPCGWVRDGPWPGWASRLPARCDHDGPA